MDERRTDEEFAQARSVAEAARRLREHELSPSRKFGDGDFDQRAHNDRARALLAELDNEIAKWRVFDR
jgi:hypothetical protein